MSGSRQRERTASAVAISTPTPGQALTSFVLANTFELEVIVAKVLVHELESFSHLAEHFAEKPLYVIFTILEAILSRP